MLAKKYKSKLVALSSPFKDIYTLEFKSLITKYKYYPGQFLHIALDPDYDGASQWPESRCFSMQSNPDQENIKITYSIKGQFTQRMEELLHIGTEVWLKLPYGDLFKQPHEKVNTVFIAGGTGITPFLSLFTHNSFKEYSNPHIYLGFRSIFYNIYMQELNSIKSYNPKIYYENIEGLIDIHKIFSENGIKSSYFISGPPDMIKLFKQVLIAKGVPKTQVLTDDWE
jgi:propane monooxygenase reductase subunit